MRTRPKTISFAQQVYAAISEVPSGRVTTYRDVAHALGTSAYRAVGQALRRNPYAPAVPCHRVVGSDGRLGGFQGKTGGAALARKRKLLEEEGVLVRDNKVVDFERKRYPF